MTEPSTKKSTRLKSISGKEYSVEELNLMASHKVSEILLYNILLELRKKGLDT